MTRKTAWAVAVVAIILAELYILNLNKELKAKLLRLQLTLIIEGVIFIGSRYVWRHLTVNVSQPSKDIGDQSRIKDHPIKSYSLLSSIWKCALFIFIFLAHISYLTNAFLIGINPHWFTIICYVCLGGHIQLITSLLCINSFLWFYNDIFCYLRNSSRKINGNSRNVLTIFLSLSYSVLVTSIGFHNTSVNPNIKTVKIQLPKLAVKSLEIVQLSDIHLGPTVGKDQLTKVVNIVNRIKPDIVVITGDLVDSTVKNLKNTAEPIKDIKAPYGKYFVTGNHEYYTGNVDGWFEYLRSKQVTVLHNENRKIQIKGQDEICIAGVDDLDTKRVRYEGHGMDLDKALKSCDPAHPIILLAHQPNAAKLALQSKYDINLILSGHTHGGQFYPFSIIIYLWNAFYAGLYKINDNSYVYVTHGTFYWGIPIRLGSRMEITHLILSSAH